MMVERFQAATRGACHLFEDPKIIELAAQFAEGFIQEVAAGNGGHRCDPSAEPGLTSPRLRWIARDSDVRNFTPGDSSMVHAVANRRTWNSLDRPSTCKFPFFDRCHNAGIANQRGGRVVSHCR